MNTLNRTWLPEDRAREASLDFADTVAGFITEFYSNGCIISGNTIFDDDQLETAWFESAEYADWDRGRTKAHASEDRQRIIRCALEYRLLRDKFNQSKIEEVATLAAAGDL